MTPRLAVTQKQAEVVESVLIGPNGDQAVLRLPERPTMPCPECNGRGWYGLGVTHPCWKCMSDGTEPTGLVPIPEGTRVEVGWWEPTAAVGGARSRAWDPVGYWHPVAFATLTEVRVSAERDYHPKLGQLAVDVILSDIKPVEADQ